MDWSAYRRKDAEEIWVRRTHCGAMVCTLLAYTNTFSTRTTCVYRFDFHCVCIHIICTSFCFCLVYMSSIRWSSFEYFALWIKRHHHMNHQVHFFLSCPCPCQSITVVEEKVECRFSSIISLSLCLFSFCFCFHHYHPLYVIQRERRRSHVTQI